jgi:hypothetical protein
MVRCLSLARALGVRPLMSVRGGAAVRETALALGADVLLDEGTRALSAVEPDVVVIDDPITKDAKRWMAAARRIGALVVTVHDLGIGARGADLVIDGSVTRSATRRSERRALIGSKFAVLDPRIAKTKRPTMLSSRVLIALGGGPHSMLAEAVASGHRRHRPLHGSANCRWLPRAPATSPSTYHVGPVAWTGAGARTGQGGDRRRGSVAV